MSMKQEAVRIDEKSYISKTHNKSKETDGILGKGGEMYSLTLLIQW